MFYLPVITWKAGAMQKLNPVISVWDSLPSTHCLKTRQLQDSLLKWSGSTVAYHDYFKTYWVGKLGSEEGYEKALMNGVVEPETAPLGAAAFNSAGVAAASTEAISKKGSGKYELVIYQKPVLGDGRQANNPWLLETPDPITRATWDNYVMVSPAFALDKEIFKDGNTIDISVPKQADEYDVHMNKPVLKVKLGSREVTLPMIIVPGMDAGTIAMAVGFGRNLKSGRATVGAGKNVYQFAAGGDFNVTGGVTVELTAEKYEVAQGQTHSSYEGRVEVVKEMKLEDFKKNPKKNTGRKGS